MNEPIEANCTRITSRLYGVATYVTIRDHEIEKVATYVVEEEAKGALVTTERGNWID